MPWKAWLSGACVLLLGINHFLQVAEAKRVLHGAGVFEFRAGQEKPHDGPWIRGRIAGI